MYCGQGEMGEGERWEGQMSAISNHQPAIECRGVGIAEILDWKAVRDKGGAEMMKDEL